MKDRIRQIMESQHMTQQLFADYIGVAPATLSSIYSGRTRPTLNVVEQLKKKIPDINTEWLMFGTGDMYATAPSASVTTSDSPHQVQQPILDFDSSPSPTPKTNVHVIQNVSDRNGVKTTPQNSIREEVKIVDKPQRRVVEIRVFYDDQTWESFSPAKK